MNVSESQPLLLLTYGGPWVIPPEKSRGNLCHVILSLLFINFKQMRVILLIYLCETGITIAKMVIDWGAF